MSESKSSQLARLIVLHGPIKSSELSEKACDKGLNIPTKNIPGLMGIHVNRGEIHVKKHNSAMWYMTESQAMDWDEDVAAAGGERDNPVGAHVMSAPAALSDDGEPLRMRLIEALEYNKVANDLLADLETALGVEHRDELLAAVAAWKSREHDLLNDIAVADLIFSQIADTLKVEKPEQILDALDELKHALSLARAMQPEPTGRLALLLIDSADLIEVDELDANCDPRIAQDAAKARIDQGHAARAVVVRIIGEAVRKVEWKEATCNGKRRHCEGDGKWSAEVRNHGARTVAHNDQLQPGSGSGRSPL